MDSVHRIKLVLSMQWPRYTEAMAASSGMETCVAHTMAPACRSRGFTIGSSNLIMCIQCAGIPELFFYRFCLVVCSRFLQTGAAKGKACHKASEFSDHSLSLLLLDRSRRCCLSLQHYRVHADEDPQWLLEHGDGLLDLCAHRLEPYMGRVFMIFA